MWFAVYSTVLEILTLDNSLFCFMHIIIIVIIRKSLYINSVSPYFFYSMLATHHFFSVIYSCIPSCVLALVQHFIPITRPLPLYLVLPFAHVFSGSWLDQPPSKMQPE